MIAILNASSETDPAQNPYRWPEGRRNYGATRVVTIANAGPTGQWLIRARRWFAHPDWAPMWKLMHTRPGAWAKMFSAPARWRHHLATVVSSCRPRRACFNRELILLFDW